jgi:hypothetical protein
MSFKSKAMREAADNILPLTVSNLQRDAARSYSLSRMYMSVYTSLEDDQTQYIQIEAAHRSKIARIAYEQLKKDE